MSSGNNSSGIGSGVTADLNLSAVDEMDADDMYDSDDSGSEMLGKEKKFPLHKFLLFLTCAAILQ